MQYRRGDIVYIEREIEQTQGHEQMPGRPAIIVSSVERGTCMVAYLTTNEARATDSDVHIRIRTAARPSVALCDQIKTVDTRRLGNFYGHVTEDEMEAVKRAMAKALGLVIQEKTISKAGEDEKMKEQLIEAKAEAKVWKEVTLKICGLQPEEG